MSDIRAHIAEIDWFARRPVPVHSPRGGRRTGAAPELLRDGQIWRVLNGSTAAVFKKIRNAGTHHPRQLAGQMAYVNGKAELVFGNGVAFEDGDAALSPEAVEDMIEDWSDGWKGRPKNGHTTHLVLSFPEYVSGEQAAWITEEWCHEMFQSIDAGLDEWSYYAALHTDIPHHPHVHVIVNNRGLRHGDWFYMAEGHDFSYQSMRQRMVEIAAPYGIYMDATSRLERGVIEYAPRDAEYRRAIRLGLEPKGREREGAALETAILQMQDYAAQCRDMADIAEGIADVTMAGKLRDAADDLENARPIVVPGGKRMDIDLTQHPADIRDALTQWAVKNEARIASLESEDRKAVTEQLHKTLEHIEAVLDRDYKVTWSPGPAQTPAFRQEFADALIGDADRLRERAIRIMETTDYYSNLDQEQEIKIGLEQEISRLSAQGYSRESLGGRLLEIEEAVIGDVKSGHVNAFMEEGVLEHYVKTGEVLDGWAPQVEAVEAAHADLSDGKLSDGATVMAAIRDRVAAAGLDPDRFQRRMEAGALDAREEENWAVSDIEAIMAHEGLNGTRDADITKATSILSSLHDFVAEKMDEVYNAHREVNQHDLRSTAEQVAKEVSTYGVAAFRTPEAEVAFLRQMRVQYGQVGLMEMSAGGHAQLSDLTDEEDQQRAIAYTVLQLEQKHHVIGLAPRHLADGLERYDPAHGRDIDGHSL